MTAAFDARMVLASRAVVLLGLLVTACGGDEDEVPHLPPVMRLDAVAELRDSSGAEVECRLDLGIELRAEVERSEFLVVYTGTLGGGAARQVLDASGAGFGFFADMHAPIRVRLTILPGKPERRRIEISHLNEVSAGSRFWRAISRFEGAVDSSGFGVGEWSCEPFDFDPGSGYIDQTYIVAGTWQLAPQR